MKLLLQNEERDVFPVVDENGVHAAGEQGGLLYETDDGIRVSVVFANEAGGAGSAERPGSQRATEPAADIPNSRDRGSVSAADDSQLALPYPSTSAEAQPDAEREFWPRPKALLLIANYKALTELGSKKGGFRTKKLMWTKLAGIINAEFGGNLTAVQVENKWKSLERRYKKTKVKNNSSGHSRVSCDYESELADVREKHHHITPTVLLTQGRALTSQPSPEQEDTASGEEIEPSSEPQAEPQLGPTKKRRRRDAPVEVLLKVIADAEAARQARHDARMALLKELISVVRTNKE
ncbi:uncharacterized protein LOC144130273 [Amblyomma americanum]